MDDLLIIIGVWALGSLLTVGSAKILGVEYKEFADCQYVKVEGFNKVVYKTKCEIVR